MGCAMRSIPVRDSAAGTGIVPLVNFLRTGGRNGQWCQKEPINGI
jgi:hypothetical protein